MYNYEYKTLHELMEQAAAQQMSLSEIIMRHEMANRRNGTGVDGQPLGCIP